MMPLALSQPGRHRVVLFGPPGAGKSTLVALAQRLSAWHAYDLESLSRTRRWILKQKIVARAALSRDGSSYVVGARADPHPQGWPRSWCKVLLLPQRHVYDQRRAARDSAVPFKARQADVYDAFARCAGAFDLIVGAPGQPVTGACDDESAVLTWAFILSRVREFGQSRVPDSLRVRSSFQIRRHMKLEAVEHDEARGCRARPGEVPGDRHEVGA